MKNENKMGFTDKMAVALIFLIIFGFIGGFILAVMSIRAQYMGALACWTACFAPVGTAVGIVLSRIVDKNRAENTGEKGGIKYVSAINSMGTSENSPEI